MSDRLEKIRKKYIGTFAEKQREIEMAWGNKDIAHVHALMHKLAGSSGGYGFDKLYKLVYKTMQLTANNQVFNQEEIQQCLQQIYFILQTTYESQSLE